MGSIYTRMPRWKFTSSEAREGLGPRKVLPVKDPVLLSRCHCKNRVNIRPKQELCEYCAKTKTQLGKGTWVSLSCASACQVWRPEWNPYPLIQASVPDPPPLTIRRRLQVLGWCSLLASKDYFQQIHQPRKPSWHATLEQGLLLREINFQFQKKDASY